MRLTDKVAIVTGATSGFGLAIARLFASEGAHLILNARRAAGAEVFLEELARAGSQAELVEGDAGEERTANELAERARTRFGRIDILILNAGIGTENASPFWETAPDEFDRVMRTNVRAVWLCARAAVPLMRRGGSIVVMASQQSYIVCEGNTTYAASKGAALQLARGMALDLAVHGIRVNALCPGICDTPLTRHYIERAADAAACEATFRSLSPLNRFGTAEEIAQHTLFLASDQSSFITGIGLIADGGTTLR